MEIVREVSFRVEAVPVPQPRQRTAARVRSDGSAFAANYVDGKHPIHAFKAAVSEAAGIFFDGEEPMAEAPIHLGVSFVVPRPKYLTKRYKTTDRVPLFGARGDWDNFGKAVSDAMEGIAYDNDCRIYSAFVQKYYAAEGESPHTLILLQEMGFTEAKAPAA